MAQRVLKRLLMRGLVWALIGLAAVAAGAGALGAWRVFMKEREARLVRDIEAASLQELTERRDALEGKLEGLSAERGIEEEIRARFPVVKPGEEVITIVNPAPAAAAGAAADKKGFWETITSWFSR